MKIAQLWTRLFLVERPSVGMAIFRILLAWTVAAHVFPSLMQLDENYLSGSFVILNPSFFPENILRWIFSLSDVVVQWIASIFVVSVIFFALGLLTRISVGIMLLGCYFFYARNSFQIGTLSFDILLVQMVLVCFSAGMGDFFSLDAVLKGWHKGYKRLRPFAVQRLLQLQLTWMFWYTAFSKFTGQGNWITENPVYYLMRYPVEGVVRSFPGKAWLAQQPEVCYGLGVFLIAFELVLPILWWIPKTRVFGIIVGTLFHVLLWVMLQVPTIFLFLFPAMMMLFIPPESWVKKIETLRGKHEKKQRPLLLFDGNCGFCRESVTRLQVIDFTNKIEIKDAHAVENLNELHADLTRERVLQEMVLVVRGQTYGGFYAFREISKTLWSLWVWVPLWYFPGVSKVGTALYRLIARNRTLFIAKKNCASGSCSLH